MRFARHAGFAAARRQQKFMYYQISVHLKMEGSYVMTLDDAFSRLRERAEPANHKCLWCAALWRLTLIDLAQNSATGRHIMIEESDIAAEVRALQVDHPDSNICREHRQKLAELEGAAA
jgi:hypothetical protein